MSGQATDQLTKLHTISAPVEAAKVATDFGLAHTINSSGRLEPSTAGGTVDAIYYGGSEADEQGAAGEFIALGPVVKVRFGGTVAPGDPVKSDSTGRFVTASGADVLAGVDCGKCFKGGDVNQMGEILYYGTRRLNATGVQAASSGNVDAITEITELTIANTVAFGMLDGKYVGQIKKVRCVAVSGTPVGTVTPTTVSASTVGGTSPASVTFKAVGQEVWYEWRSDGWKIINVIAAGIEAVTASTSANPLFLIHTANIADTVTFAQPNGWYPGQKARWIASANSGTPNGTVTGLFYDEDGSADGTSIAFNAAADQAMLEWDGLRWLATAQVSAAIS